MRDIRNVDFFRKIPRDLTSGTYSGAILSAMGAVVLVVLVLLELSAYLTVNVTTDVVVDASADALLRLRFNVSLPNVPCEFASVDVQDIMKTRKHNITSNIEKWHLDSETGLAQLRAAEKTAAPRYAIVQHDGDEKSHELTGETEFKNFVLDNDVALVNFYAPWCVWCQRLHPVWEVTAVMVAKKYGQAVHFAKMDCTNPQNHATCHKNHINAFPTIIVYRNHNEHSHEFYHGDRSPEAISGFIDELYQRALAAGEITPEHIVRVRQDGGAPAAAKTDEAAEAEVSSEKPTGCLVLGFVDVRKVPGNLLFVVESEGMTFNNPNVNFTHVIHELSFGPQLTERQESAMPQATLAARYRLNKQYFVSDAKNASHEHYVKVIGSELRLLGGEPVSTYTYTANSHQYVDDSNVPAVKITYDMSPMSIIVSETTRPFYNFVTSMCAIVGGVFTVLGIIDSMVYHSINTLKKKMQLGKQL